MRENQVSSVMDINLCQNDNKNKREKGKESALNQL
jgi:hypothetical protein